MSTSCACNGKIVEYAYPSHVSAVSIQKTEQHPCYGKSAHQYARMHIPVAPKCNIQCGYCNRKYDCVNESRPGVTSEVLNPEGALEKYKAVKKEIPNLKVLGIAGPGDALANFEQTKRSVELIRAYDPDVTFCLSTNGLLVPAYAEEIVDLGFTHVTITMNAIDPRIGAKVYQRVVYKGKVYTGEEGAKLLLENQLKGLTLLAERGVLCKVNVVMIKGINDDHIEAVVKKAKELGAFISNIIPLIPTKDTLFADIEKASPAEIQALRVKCGEHLNQMFHCRQCRADAIGMLSEDRSAEFRQVGCKSESIRNIS